MTRQSITLTSPNDAWLKSQISTYHEYSNKSELINDLITQARRADIINQKLAQSESSGFINQSKEEMLKEFRRPLYLSKCRSY